MDLRLRVARPGWHGQRETGQRDRRGPPIPKLRDRGLPGSDQMRLTPPGTQVS